MIEQDDHLSPQGQARREAMLGDLTAAMTTLRRRRRALRLGVSAATTTLLCFALFRTSQVPTTDTRVATNPPPASSETVASRTEHVQTDQGITARLRASPPTLVTRINDAQLLHTLVEIGRPAGLIRFGDRVALSAPVTDEERSPSN